MKIPGLKGIKIFFHRIFKGVVLKKSSQKKTKIFEKGWFFRKQKQFKLLTASSVKSKAAIPSFFSKSLFEFIMKASEIKFEAETSTIHHREAVANVNDVGYFLLLSEKFLNGVKNSSNSHANPFMLANSLSHGKR